MRPITVADAKLVLRHADTFKEMGVPVEVAARKALTRWPINKEAATILLDAVDVSSSVPVEIGKHGERKTYRLLEAIIASGIYTPEELCAKYDPKQLVKAARTVLVSYCQFGYMSYKGVELLLHMKVNFSKLIKTNVTRKVMYSLSSLDRWFTNVKKPSDVPSLAKSIAKTIVAATTHTGVDIGYILGEYTGNMDMIKEVADALDPAPVPAVYGSGAVIRYGARVAVWLRARYGASYCGRVELGYDRKIKIPCDVDESEFKAMIVGQISTFGIGSIVYDTTGTASSIMQAAVNEYLFNDTQKEDII